MSSDDIRRAARMILDGRVREGQRALVGAAWDAIERGVLSASKDASKGTLHETDPTGLDPVAAFLKVKFQGFQLSEDEADVDPKVASSRRDKFLRELVAKDDCVGFIFTAARNLAIDSFRRPGVRTVPLAEGGASPEDFSEDSGVFDLGLDAEASVEESTTPNGLELWIDELEPQQALTLRVTYSPSDVRREDVITLASRRNVPVAHVEMELETRHARYTEQRLARARVLETRLARLRARRDREELLRKWERDHFGPYERAADRVDDSEPSVAGTIDPAVVRPLVLSRNGFVRADDRTRLQVYLYIRQLVEHAERLYQQAREDCLQDEQPNFREVALILGELAPEADDATAEQKANTVGTRVARLLKKLGKIHRQRTARAGAP